MNEIDPELRKNFSFAEKLFLEKKYQEAIRYYKNILVDHPNLIEAINNIGQSYEYLDQLDLSLKYYKKCSTMISGNKIFVNNVANIYYKKKNYNNAIKELEKSLLIDDNQINIVKRKVECLIKLNLREEVKFFLNKYILKIPNDSALNTLQGKNLIALNQHKAGLEFLKIGTGFIEFDQNKVNII